jgi:hypothetical protein
MKTALIIILLFSHTALYASGYPRDELEFCPAGGPTGWMNYFDKKHNEKALKHYYRMQHAYYRSPGYYARQNLYPASRPVLPAQHYAYPGYTLRPYR